MQRTGATIGRREERELSAGADKLFKSRHARSHAHALTPGVDIHQLANENPAHLRNLQKTIKEQKAKIEELTNKVRRRPSHVPTHTPLAPGQSLRVVRALRVPHGGAHSPFSPLCLFCGAHCVRDHAQLILCGSRPSYILTHCRMPLHLPCPIVCPSHRYGSPDSHVDEPRAPLQNPRPQHAGGAGALRARARRPPHAGCSPPSPPLFCHTAAPSSPTLRAAPLSPPPPSSLLLILTALPPLLNRLLLS